MEFDSMSVVFTSMEDLAHGASLLSAYEKSVSAPTTPTETAKLTHGVSGKKRRGKGHRVNFPADDRIVSGYVEPPDPWSNARLLTTEDLVEAYKSACLKQGVKPLSRIIQQLQAVKVFGEREQDFMLKGEKLDGRQCEALEEVFKAVQFNSISVEGCHLDEEGSATLFDMIEYYESAAKLNISFNKHIDSRGWQACSRMLKKTPCLHFLDARNTGLNEQTLLILGRALRLGSYLTTLHVENCALSGRSLVILVAALKLNSVLKELYLGENGMCSADGLQLANLLRSNSYLDYLDLRSNNLQDLGISHLSDGLGQQPDGPGDGLKTLVLWSNSIGASGMQHLCRALNGTRSLVTLNLGHNSLTNDGIHILKDSLIRNKTLCNLGLQNVKMSCEGAVALAEYVADSKNITRLDLRGNTIQLAGLMALARSLSLNKTVTRLDIDPVKSGPGASGDGLKEAKKLFQEISEYCQRNKEIVKTTSCNGINQPPGNETSETANTSPNHKRPLSASLSVNTVINGSQQPSPALSPNSRFRVSRVCLESEAEHSSPTKSFEPVLERSNSAPAVVSNSRFTVTPVNSLDTDSTSSTVCNNNNVYSEDQNFTKDSFGINETDYSFAEEVEEDSFKGHSVSEPVNIKSSRSRSDDNHLENPRDLLRISGSPSVCGTSPPWFVYPSLQNDRVLPSQDVLENKNSSIKPTKRITFVLPEGALDQDKCSISSLRKDRRMSTPAMPASRYMQRPKQLTLKLCKQLESLDLRSSVPLSPTRLLEGWVFPEPTMDIKFPPEGST